MTRNFPTESALLVVLAGMLGACWPNPPGAAGTPASPTDASEGDADVKADSASSDDGGDDGASSADASGGASDGGAAGVPAPTLTLTRFADWSPGTPSFDVCVAPHGSNHFRGPMLQSVDQGAPLGDSGSPGLTFPLVSSYFPLAPGAYDVRFVVAGAPDCTSSLAPALPDQTTMTLAAGSAWLIALLGDAVPGLDGGAPLTVLTLADDVVVDPTWPYRVRLINASPDFTPAALGSGIHSNWSFDPFFQSVPYGQVGAAIENGASLTVDSNGYVAVQKLDDVVLSACLAGQTTDALTTKTVYVAPGNLVTFVTLPGVPPAPVSLLDCLDTAPGTMGLSFCSVLQ